jgi:serine/threonine protein kinase
MSANELIVDYKKVQILAELGRGSYGVVYKGVWKNKKVAIKKLIGEKVNEHVEEFKREAELMKYLPFFFCDSNSFKEIRYTS